jgi:hypothetical protein
VITVPTKLQLPHDPGGEEAYDVGSGGHLEPRPYLFGYGSTAEQVAAFQNERLQARPAEVRRAYEAVVTPSHDDDVVLWHRGHPL